MKTRVCRYCGMVFELKDWKWNNRQYCSWNCSRKGNWHRMKVWRKENPELRKMFDRNKPSASKEYQNKRYESRRREQLFILGGKCVVCNETNPLWLQIHYKQGTNGYGWRHPRSLAFTRNHKDDFEILCANHHQEHSITSNIYARKKGSECL